MTEVVPVVGDWYRRLGADLFEVVAIDDDDRTVDVQYFDGTVEEIDLDTWCELLLEEAEAPEDWSGSMDVDREDFMLDIDELPENGWSSALDFLDQAE